MNLLSMAIRAFADFLLGDRAHGYCGRTIASINNENKNKKHRGRGDEIYWLAAFELFGSVEIANVIPLIFVHGNIYNIQLLQR